MRAASQTSKTVQGNYLTLAQLVRVLPNDYMLHVISGDNEVWTGITWVFMYDCIFIRYRDCCVKKFEIDYNNTDVTVKILPIS